ncbi:MAG: Cna B-type domain-containing protein [Peptostreptococcaceae bacterium]
MQTSIIKKILLAFVVMIFMVPTYIIEGKEAIDINKKASIIISHHYKNQPISNTKFNLYKIADVSESAKFVLSGDFAKFNIEDNILNDSTKWSELSATLTNNIKVNNIKAQHTSTTNNNGNIKFSDLDTGLYLVEGETGTINEGYIKTKPFLVSLPNQNKNQSSWNYDIEVNTKNEFILESTIDYTAQKIWLNDDEKTRPKSIQVSLYNGKNLIETVELNIDNQWKHTWNDLDIKGEWSVVENNVPKGYSVSYEKYTTSIKVKNTYEKIVPPITDEKLPQTGMLFWPITLLASLGILLIYLGKKLNSK